MHRPVSLLVAALAIGCTPTESAFDHQAELSVDARGVGLALDGLRGQVGMYGTTCAVDTRNAAIGADLNIDETSETVHDAGEIEGREVFLIESGDGLHLQDANNPIDVSEASLSGTFERALVYDLGAVGLSDGTLQWTDGRTLAVGAVDSFDLAQDGTAFVADGEVYKVVDDQLVAIASGDRVAVSPDGGLVFAAQSGEPMLHVLDATGVEQHAVFLDGDVREVAALGERGEALVVLEKANGTGELVVVDGSGSINAWVGTPTAALGITSSSDGHTIAVSAPGSVHFFGLE
ncbi:MAG: hypothetical protein EP330_19070 [Deltaproteobacteria bacterium]|nr:MAG: hypothetical protein EP330_19070 [Deltaproteobacteria bacterium]